MDIFSSTRRKHEDAIKKPLNYPESDVTQRKLQADNDRQIEQFRIYLKNVYAKFDFKINRCKYDCINNAKSYKEVRQCQEKCGSGVSKFSQYINERVQEMQQGLGECVHNANTLPNTLSEIYYCYDSYNSSFIKLKQFITEQSMYYE